MSYEDAHQHDSDTSNGCKDGCTCILACAPVRPCGYTASNNYISAESIDKPNARRQNNTQIKRAHTFPEGNADVSTIINNVVLCI